MNHAEADTRVKSMPARFWFLLIVLAVPLLESLLVSWAFLPYRFMELFIISMTSLDSGFGITTAYVGIATMVMIAFRLLSVPVGTMLIVMLFQSNRRFHSIMMWYVWAHVAVATLLMLVRMICFPNSSLVDWSALFSIFAAIAFTIYSRNSNEYTRVFKHTDLDALARRLNKSE